MGILLSGRNDLMEKAGKLFLIFRLLKVYFKRLQHSKPLQERKGDR
jgi:hypothetical protein